MMKSLMMIFQIFNFQFSIFNCKKVLILFTCYTLVLHVSAQSVSASLDRDKILLGEQVTLQLEVNNVNTASTFVASWPQINDTLDHAEIIKSGLIDTINVNGLNTFQQKFTITSFDSGRWQLGPFIFLLQNKESGKQIQLATSPVYLTVLPVDVSSMKDYHPIKDIIDVETSFNWLPVIITAAIVIAAIIIFFILKNRKSKSKSAPKVVLKGTPLERAIEKLQVLEKEPLTSPASIKKFHSDADIIIRQYFEEILYVKALQLTISELFSNINVYMQDRQLKSQFQQLFELNGSVKYAKYLPQNEESRNTLNEIVKCLYQIDDLINQARNNVNRMVPKY